MKKFRVLISGLLTSALLLGCSSLQGPDVSAYKDNMSQFFDNVAALDEAINNLDTSQDDYVATLMTYLDQLDQTFTQMGALEVPNGFTGVKELSEDAASNMTEAVANYHTAFEGGEYRDDIAQRAYLAYAKASSELQYIIRILHGEKYEDIFAKKTMETE